MALMKIRLAKKIMERKLNNLSSYWRGRAKLILRWEELENKERSQYQVPQTVTEALILAAKQQE